MSETDDTLTVAVAGDAMVTQRLTRLEDDGFREIQRIIADADASMVNLEGPLCDYESFPIAGPLAHFRSPPWAVDELVSTGFDLFSVANNHVGDYGQPRMTATIEALEQRSLPFAGIGRNLATARADVSPDASRANRVGRCDDDVRLWLRSGLSTPRRPRTPRSRTSSVTTPILGH